MSRFILRRQVEFNHCDPAGIVFYPRYFEMLAATTERFFADVVDYGFGTADMSVPLGDVHASFTAPSRLGEWLDFSLSINEIGKTSVTFAITCTCAEQTRFVATLTLIHANPAKGKSAPWPDRVRTAMGPYLTDTKETPG